MLKFNFIPHFAIRIACTFIFFTVIGTLSHEYGHIAVAKYFGYETELHYGSMGFDYASKKQDPMFWEIKKIIKENEEAFKNREDFPSKPRYLELVEKLNTKILSGPGDIANKATAEINVRSISKSMLGFV